MQQVKNSKGLGVSTRGKILVIEFNAYEKKNAFFRTMYTDVCNILHAAAKDDQITTVVITGTKDYFSSGASFAGSEFAEAEETIDTFFKTKFHDLIAAFIEFPKLIIALVNGPAIGIGTTICALCDMVWCVDTAYFQTPFTKLAICPEASSSYLFPLILGRSKATELLLLSEPMSAAEALQFQFVSRVFKITELADIWKKIEQFSELSPNTMMVSKRLIRLHSRPNELAALKLELAELIERFKTEEFFQVILNIAAKHKKPKPKL